MLDERLIVCQSVSDLHALSLVHILLFSRSLRSLAPFLQLLLDDPVVELRRQELVLLVDVRIVAAQTKRAASAIAHSNFIQKKTLSLN